MKRNLFSLIHPLYIAILIKSCYLKQCFIKIKTLLNRGSSYLSTIYRLPVFPRQKKTVERHNSLNPARGKNWTRQTKSHGHVKRKRDIKSVFRSKTLCQLFFLQFSLHTIARYHINVYLSICTEPKLIKKHLQRGEKRSTKENYQPPWSKRQRIYINQSQESGVR